MAIHSANNSDYRYNCGSDASLDDWTEVTWALIIKPTSDSGSGPRLLSKGDNIRELKVTTNAATEFSLHAQFDRATTDAVAASALNSTGDLTIGTWYFVAVTYSETNSRIQLWVADLDAGAVVAEVDSYDTQDGGSGASVADAAIELWLSNRAAGGRSGDVDTAWWCVIEEELNTANELEQLRNTFQHDAMKGGWFAWDAAATIPDYTGNGNDAVTGGTAHTTVAHAPHGMPFGFDAALPYEVAAVGGLSIPVAMHGYRRRRVA